MLRAPGPIRTFAAITLVNTIGNGLLATVVVLYFTHVVGLGGGQVGVGLTVAGVFGVVVGVPVGHLADRRGPREVLAGILVCEVAAVALYVVTRSFVAFLVVAALVVTLNRAESAVRQGFIAQALPPADRVRGRAVLRSVTNVGFAIGSGIAALAIVIDTRAAYDTLILGDAASYALALVLTLRLPHVPPQPPAAEGPRLVVLRDRPYLAVMALVAIMTLHYSLLDVGIPLWIGHTDAPRVTVGIVFFINCVLVAALSVPMARGSETVSGAARVAVLAAVLLAASCVVFALSGAVAGAATAALVVVTAAVVEVFGEMTQAASSWGLSFGLAPEDAQGQYQGLASSCYALAAMLGPALMAAIVALGTAGWLAFGALFLAAGFATVPVSTWAEDRRRGAVRV
ncbi:MFS transporter [Conexibacter woesei]|uniref:MFS transporter n=1 Tax=Conexibacter woesei TaxID=191495 RepID=UPI0018CAE00B|nr:MFS transporter [Conexibacter woesei]